MAAERKWRSGVCGRGSVAGVQAMRARKEGYGGGGTMSEEKLDGVVQRFPIGGGADGCRRNLSELILFYKTRFYSV